MRLRSDGFPAALVCTLALLVSACGPSGPEAEPRQSTEAAAPEKAVASGNAAVRLNDLADRFYTFQLQYQPEIAYFSGVELDSHDGLSDNSPAGLAKFEQFEDALLNELNTIDAGSLNNKTDWLTYGFLRQSLISARDTRVCRNELWNVSQMGGWHLNYTQLADMQPVGSAKLRAQALARWRKLPGFIDQEILNLRAGLKAGYSSPKSAVRKVIGQLDGLLAMALTDSPFASPARRDEDPAFKAEFVAMVESAILPAATRYRDFVRDEYLAQAREALTVTANPNGRACYEASLRANTTLDRSPEEVFALGEKTVNANRERVIELGRKAYGLNGFSAIIERIKSDAQDKFSSKEELLAFSQERVRAAAEVVPLWFGHVPTRPAEVQPFPDYQEGTGRSAHYVPGTESRPGVYRIPLFAPETQSRGAAETTAFHEVWPGHHLQISIAQEIKGLHRISQILAYGGMVEGWARYSEALADEMGLYATVTGPINRLAWPARGMVVDPGIHVFGWTREQAVAFINESGRMDARGAEDIVDRIAVMPGQLTSYDSGGLEIFALRKLAEDRLGDTFDIKAFHDRVLENGSVPLTLLREHIESWLDRVAPAKP